MLPIDAIQEFNLENNLKAEFGWLTGTVINVGIKTGTNNLHGSFYAFGRDGSWDARNYFNPKPQPNANNGENLENWGGSLGGPIKKDKLFFFGAFEERRDFLASSFSLEYPGKPRRSVRLNVIQPTAFQMRRRRSWRWVFRSALSA